MNTENSKHNNKEKPELRNFCNETELFIDDYLDGMITVKDQEKMDDHIATCAFCKKYLDDSVLWDQVRSVLLHRIKPIYGRKLRTG